MINLEGTIRRFIGRASDAKPLPGVQQPDGTTLDPNELVPGSSFLEADTGRVWRWTGTEWVFDETEDPQERLLAEIVLELREIRQHLQLLTLETA